MGDMDSGNSGSMQSSSTGGGGGDDQEFDSRGAAALYNAAAMSNFSLDNMTPPPPLQLYSFSNTTTNNNGSSFAHHQVSNYFDHPPTLSQSSSLECPNFIINQNHPNNATNNNHNHNNNNNNNNNQLDMVWPNKYASIRPSMSTDDDATCTEGRIGYSITNNHQQNPPPQPLPSPAPPPVTSPRSSTGLNNTGSVRNPKKRSRASRRAPTTVLTTDTTNFRQMVQEFTGIPAPPFTAFSNRTRFDLFSGLGGGGGGGGHSTSVVPPPPYLLRPFAQKIAPTLHQPSFLANATLPSHTTTTSTINNTSGLVDGFGLSVSTTSASTTGASTTIAPPATTTFQLCDPQEFLSNTNNNAQLSFQSLLQPNSTTVTCSTSTPTHHQTNCSVNPAGGNGNYRGISTTSALVNGASDNIGGATKGEGMVDSWICSSD